MAVGLATVVDIGAQASVAHQVRGMREAGNVAYRRQNNHRRDEADAGQLDEEGDLVGPGGNGAETGQFLFYTAGNGRAYSIIVSRPEDILPTTETELPDIILLDMHLAEQDTLTILQSLKHVLNCLAFPLLPLRDGPQDKCLAYVARMTSHAQAPFCPHWLFARSISCCTKAARSQARSRDARSPAPLLTPPQQ